MRRKGLLLKQSGNERAQEVCETFVKVLHFSGEQKSVNAKFLGIYQNIINFFFSLSLTKRPNNLECLYFGKPFHVAFG
jgi:hypothetical protein